MRQAASIEGGRRGARRIIERPRLIKLLDDAAAQTILLIAPAGYGKTTLTRQWAGRRTGVHWYTARTGSADVAQLAVELAETLEGVSPGLTDYVAKFVRARPSPAQQATEIVDGFAGASGDLSASTLVIDDYHLIAADETAERFVNELREKLGFRVVVASRVRPRWATARLQIYGESLELGPEELALTEDEAKDVLGGARRQPELLSQARGWPAVVGLAAQARADSAALPEGAASALFRFFAEELFLATPAELQEQLITLALLPSLAKPLVDAALGGDSDAVIESAIESGLATVGPESAELHPLVREYLYTKLRGRPDAAERVRAVFEASVEASFWDHGFELIERFSATELLDSLLEFAFKPLLSSGRIATLERIAQYAHSTGADASPLVGLVDAELAFRNGLFAQAESIAVRAARLLRGKHRFESNAWWLAGMGAELSFEDPAALSHFEQARRAAREDDDLRNALWGLLMASSQAETPDCAEALERIVRRRELSPVDLVRATTAQLHAWRLGVRPHRIDGDEAWRSLRDVEDPRIRTSFLNQYSYNLILWGRYDTATQVATAFGQLIEEFRLAWAEPHAHWALAASALGERRFAIADNWLRKVEREADRIQYGQLVLNASCIRSRLLLALQRAEDAQSALAVDETLPANRAMQGEFLATRAMVLAVLGDIEASAEDSQRARELTVSVEAHAHASCAEAICAQRQGASPSELVQCVETCKDLGVSDALVAAVRAWPSLLEHLSAVRNIRSEMVTLLRRSHDYDLARRARIDLGRRPRQSAGSDLSRREREVLELIQRGLTNAEIARALFISETTVKVHVRHILEKTGARSRTEAAISFSAES